MAKETARTTSEAIVRLVATKANRIPLGAFMLLDVSKQMVSLKPSIVSRSFHINLLYRSNCDFGGPCNCTECRGDAKRLVAS
jgi:hypothetical protein